MMVYQTKNAAFSADRQGQFCKDASMENLGAWCMSEDKRAMMKFLDCDEKYYFGHASDFEYLAEWERILAFCAGTGSAKLYEEQLALLEISGYHADGSRRSACELWQEGNAILTSKKESEFIIKQEKIIEKQGLCVFHFIMKNIKSASPSSADFSCLTENLWRCLETSEGEAVHLRLDASALSYARPDRYHASLVWQRLFRGEKINQEETFVLCFQLLIEGLLSLKQRKKHAVVHLFATDRSLCEQTAKYLKENRLLDGELRVGMLLDRPMIEWISIFQLGEKKFRILPELLFRPADFGVSLRRSLDALLSVYPIGALRFGGILTESFSLSLVAQKLLFRELDAFLSQEGICDEKRQKILTNFFDS